MVMHLALYWILSRPVHFWRNLMFYHHNACEQSEQTPCSAYLLFKEVLINWIHQLPEGTFSAKTVKVIFQRYYFWVSISSFCLRRQLEPLLKGLKPYSQSWSNPLWNMYPQTEQFYLPYQCVPWDRQTGISSDEFLKMCSRENGK